MPGGIYSVNEDMIKYLKSSKYGEHASNLGGLIAYELAKSVDIEAFIADPVVVDELMDIARISGHPDIERKSIFHALNQKAIAMQLAEKLNKDYNDLNLIIVHMGGGISVGAHKKGKVVDVNNALDGDGPFTPERSGTLPLTGVMKLCYSGDYELIEVKKMLKGKGGLVSYLGTNNVQEVKKMIKDGNKKAEAVYKAMAFKISKWIGKMSTAMNFEVDAIALTGGIAYDQTYMDKWIKERVEFIAPVYIFPGGDEERALAMSAYRALKGEQDIKSY
jgi:butyrate kinase